MHGCGSEHGEMVVWVAGACELGSAADAGVEGTVDGEVGMKVDELEERLPASSWIA